MARTFFAKYAAHAFTFVCTAVMLVAFFAMESAAAFFNPAMLLIPAAAVIGAVLTLWGLVMKRFDRLASYLTVGAGLLGIVYFVLFFVQQNPLPNLVSFWLALGGAIGLIAQVAIPRAATIQAVEAPKSNTKISRKGGSVDLTQNLGVAFDALIANKLRSGLTMLGVIIGVMAVVSLISIGNGAQTAITDQIQNTGLNLLFVTPNGSQTLTIEDAEVIEREVEGINAVLPQFSQNFRVRSDNDNITTSVIGVPPRYAEVTNLEIQIGRFLTDEDYNSRARVAILGSSAVEELFGGLNPLGRVIRIGSQRFEVIGVLDEQDSSFGGDANLTIYVPLSTGYRNLFNARAAGSTDERVSNIRVSVTNVEDTAPVTAEIERLLRDRHRIEVGEDDDFSVIDQQMLLDIASQITGILTVLLGAIASVSLLVGGIGIMNISLVSVTERTKEIGLRKAIGARRSHILQQFLIETMVLSTLGGTIGVLLGIGIAMLVNASGVLTATITPDSILLGLGFSILVGVFFGVYPATRAASLPPIEALRYE